MGYARLPGVAKTIDYPQLAALTSIETTGRDVYVLRFDLEQRTAPLARPIRSRQQQCPDALTAMFGAERISHSTAGRCASNISPVVFQAMAAPPAAERRLPAPPKTPIAQYVETGAARRGGRLRKRHSLSCEGGETGCLTRRRPPKPFSSAGLIIERYFQEDPGSSYSRKL
jgi:hypothetical protein